MDNKNQLKQALQKFIGTDDKTLEAFQTFSKSVSKLQSDLKEKIQVATLDKVNGELSNFQKKIDYTPLIDAFEKIKNEIISRDTELTTNITDRMEELRAELSDARGKNKDTNTSLKEEISQLELKLIKVSNRKPPEFPDFLTPIKESEKRVLDIINNLEKFDDTELKKEIGNIENELEDKIKKLRTELISKIGEIGGGNMNRQIKIGGTNVLTKYTDINWKAGNNVTITYANNETTKMVDITVTGSAGGSGIVRSISSVAINTNAGATAGTDYVYLVLGTITITLPTAVGNTNLYTIKNVGTGVVTVATTSSQTIDGSLTQIMPVQFTSIDVSSDTANWNIT